MLNLKNLCIKLLWTLFATLPSAQENFLMGIADMARAEGLSYDLDDVMEAFRHYPPRTWTRDDVLEEAAMRMYNSKSPY